MHPGGDTQHQRAQERLGHAADDAYGARVSTTEARTGSSQGTQTEADAPKYLGAMTADSGDAYQENDKYADDSLNDDEVDIVTDGADGKNDSDELDPTQTVSEAPGKRHGAQGHQADDN